MPEHTLTARFDDPDRARKAVTRLSLAGIDGRRMSIRGADPSEGSTSRASNKATDRVTGSEMVRRVVVGGIVGIVVGVPLFLLLIALAPATLVDWSIGYAAFLGAALGGGTGMAFGLMAVPAMAPAWEDTNRPWRGTHTLVVSNVEDGELEHVRGLIEDQLPEDARVHAEAR